MEYFVISAKFVPLKYYTLSSQLQRLTSFSVGCSGRRILSPGRIAVMRKWSIGVIERLGAREFIHEEKKRLFNLGGFTFNWKSLMKYPLTLRNLHTKYVGGYI